MKKETPHSLKCRAGLANGLKDDGARRRKLTMGRDQTAKRSPKERSAVPGTVTSVSKVALDHLGRSHHQMGQSDGSAPAGRIAEAWERPGHSWRGLFVHAFSSGSLQLAIPISTSTFLVFSSDAKRKMKITRTMIEDDPTLLREILKYDPETGVLTWRVRGVAWFVKDEQAEAWNARYAGKPAFVVFDTRGYLNGKIFSHRYFAHRVIWALVHGVWPERVDHISGVRTDNRIANLRNVSGVENDRNRKRPITNTSGVIGVVWHKGKQRWVAQIGVDNRMIFIGQFADFEEAVAARKAAEVEYGYHENHGRGVAA